MLYLIGALAVLTMTYYNPRVVVRAYSWFVARHVVSFDFYFSIRKKFLLGSARRGYWYDYGNGKNC